MLTYKRALSLTAFLSILYLLLMKLPHHAREENTLREHLSLLFPYDISDDLPKHIWQTWKYAPLQKEFASEFHGPGSSWTTLNPDFEHEVLTDEAARSLIARLYSRVPQVQQAFEALPEPILKADFFRYLVLLARGGIYSDIDTTALKPATDWIPADLLPYGLAVGIEADPNRPDWHDFYARRIQFCQWTIVSKPGHPVLVDIVASITEETLVRKALAELKQETMKIVMEFTGPGIWTDSLFKFFNKPRQLDGEISKPRNVTWERFANLTKPIKESDVVVLPITSFSPDVGHMGAQSSSDPLAFVLHGFSGKMNCCDCDGAHADTELGTWKHKERSASTAQVST